MERTTRVAAAAILLLLSSTCLANALTFSVTDLGSLSEGSTTAPYAISDSGLIVGSSNNEAFLYSGGVMTGLGLFGSINSTARAVNDSGQVLVTTGNSTVPYRAFVYDNGEATEIGDASASKYVYDMNSTGQVIGKGPVSSSLTTPFVFDGVLNEVPGLSVGAQVVAINNTGQIAGSANFEDRREAIIYENGLTTRLGTLGGRSFSRDLNNQGQVVGSWFDSDSLERAFIYEDGAMRDLGTMGYLESEAVAINDLGQVVGWAHSDIWEGQYLNRSSDIFLYDGASMLSVNGMIDPSENAYLTSVFDMNNSGQIVGVGYSEGQRRALLLTPDSLVAPVPLPGGLPLLFSALGIYGVFGRRKSA